MRKIVLLAASIAALTIAPRVAGATLIHDYELNGTLADSLGGPALTALGGTLSASGYSFNADQGLVYTAGFAKPGDYSIELRFSLDDSDGGYAKIIDFLNLTSDNGLYAYHSQLDFYPDTQPSGPAVFKGTQVADVLLTRSAATGQVTGWVNNTEVFSFHDTSHDAVFSTPTQVVNFFVDDAVTGGSEAVSGYVDSIKIWNGALAAPIPEPSGSALLLAGLCTLLLRARRNGGRSN